MIYVDYKVKLLPMWIVWHLRCRCTNISCQKILHELLFSGHFTTPQLATRFARELFKPCKDSVESAMKIKFWFRVFCEWRHWWNRFLAIVTQMTWP